MGFLIPSKPVMEVELEPIEVTIRKEQARLQDIEFDTDEKPNTYMLDYMRSERARGITQWVTNL